MSGNRKTNKRWKETGMPFLLLAAFILLSAFLTGCSEGSGSAQAKAEAKTKADKVLRIGYQKGDPLNIVKERGNLEKRLQELGYAVTWNVFPAGPPLLEALSSGNLDVGRTGDSPPVFAQAAGSPLVYVGAGHSKAKGSAVLVKKDSAIHTIADLKGKSIGLAKGSSSHYLLVKALESANLTYEDVTLSFLAPADARIAFEQGKVDAWVVWDPYFADIENTGQVRVLTDGQGLADDRDFYLASDVFAREHGDIVKVLLEEVEESSRWANENPKEVAKLLAPLLKIDVAALEKAAARRTYGLEELDDAMVKGQQEIADTFYALKLIPKKISVADAVFHPAK
ncbi:sulfonate ABC transporter substrate-binding protein [Brevibacillus massiliensis]|uniref:sulfonate ABC transporter substrate-binding protein n=1 Tax=Brevibacillus massiliensis TaxID=1118054 RepID=UPI0002D9D5B1|nr:sulfonate ABC transporter substrate-binding protein [Brevibacillus massiliensis]